MSPRPTLALLSLALISALALVACGGESPLSASNPQGAVLKGTVMGVAGASSTSASKSSADTVSGVVTVTVQENPAITATVGADGSFTLRGLPDGSFTLAFFRDGVLLGTLVFGEVLPNQEITITIDVSGGSVVLVEEQRNGIGHGDVELEGLVQAVLVLNPTGESRFQIQGRIVVARPGETAIREGNTARTVADVTIGRQVHVKGVWLPAEGSVQPVLAHEIKLQDNQDDGDTTADCLIHGGRVGDPIELEGHVASGAADSFMLQVNGNRAAAPVEVDAKSAEFQCHPKSAGCQDKVTVGAQVHVSGTLRSCNTSGATVDASKVIVQR